MTLHAVADAVVEPTRAVRRRAPLIAVSGIDGSSKSTFAPALVTALEERRLHAAVVTLDPRHTPAPMRLMLRIRRDRAARRSPAAMEASVSRYSIT
jgi:putative protein kinase ArgK-like GTPase of G3E family